MFVVDQLCDLRNISRMTHRHPMNLHSPRPFASFLEIDIPENRRRTQEQLIASARYRPLNGTRVPVSGNPPPKARRTASLRGHAGTGSGYSDRCENRRVGIEPSVPRKAQRFRDRPVRPPGNLRRRFTKCACRCNQQKQPANGDENADSPRIKRGLIEGKTIDTERSGAIFPAST